MYTFRPIFEPRVEKYICHAILAGAVPVPINAVTGKREEGGYEFFYQEWNQENPTRENCRFGATREDLFPTDRDVKLDLIFLKKMGLSKQRMKQCNALFFYQLLLAIVDPAISGIDGDTRMGYYKDVARNTNMYAFGVKNRGGTCGHVFRPTTAEELLVWDGIVCWNINTNIAESWMMNKFNTFDQEIMEAIHFRRWLNIKACLKQNEFRPEKKKTDKGYDPTQKYRMVWDVMTRNMNQLIDKGDLDVTMDEATWQNSSYADIQGCLQGKKTDRGGQYVLLLDSKRGYIYADTPCHKFFEVVPPFTATSPAQVKRLVDMITPLLVGTTKDPTDKRKQISSEFVHIAMDNHFSGDDVLHYLGEGGWKETMTCRHDRLTKSVPRKYFNFIKAAPVNARSKVA